MLPCFISNIESGGLAAKPPKLNFGYRQQKRLFVKGRLKGLKIGVKIPFKTYFSPYSGIVIKGVLEGRSPSKEIVSPFSLSRGRGIKGDRVT